MSAGRKGLADEVVGDVVVLPTAEQNRERLVHGSPGAPHLLVIVNDRAWPLEMNHESEIGLVESHPQCHRRYERLHFIAQEFPFQLLPACGIRVICLGGQAA